MRSNPFVKAIKSALSGSATQKKVSAKTLVSEAIAEKVKTASLSELMDFSAKLQGIEAAGKKEAALKKEARVKSGIVQRVGRISGKTADGKTFSHEVRENKEADGKVVQWVVKDRDGFVTYKLLGKYQKACQSKGVALNQIEWGKKQ